MRIVGALVAVALAATGLTGCAGSSGDGRTLRVVYQRWGDFVQLDQHLARTKAEFEREHPGTTVELVPVVAPENEYLPKVRLMLRAPATAPDVLYEDSYHVNADVAAGYLHPLDDHLARWPDWAQFVESTRQAGRAVDGRTYGVPIGTDTRGLWYNRRLFAQAGLPTDWRPASWADVLAAARAVKARLPDVIAFDMPAGRPVGEAAAMQSMQMLLHGTDTGVLYDEREGRWVAPSAGFADALRFVREVFASGLGPTPAQVADPYYSKSGKEELTRSGRVAIRLDGSWLPGNWLSGAPVEWPEWRQIMGTAPMPTQRGQHPGRVSLSGGWLLSVGAGSRDKDAAFAFVTKALSREGALAYNTAASDLPVRKDVAADPRVGEQNPTIAFWSSLLEITRYRPTLVEYPRVSQEIQVAMEQVVNGADPEEAARAWAERVRQVVGVERTRSG
ncbi:extracellular solute-binding protein [Streptoalloteichus hindustanus]|uniref:Carbohydrate ABC transporter substrate-binding protein, CUT1 family n=1 Tax=Streptoalloteichus hindustanus TaxID=2017 RepID=A0A1M4UIL1_STRHI|nr:extracellular solute-binding protein [Streptoalloteichus hindustanus]SHE56612.1 carbohydrate ABC transporter substrate-binding protein, CUT1 family [Streptoalloteichus hindustanus]